MNDGEWLVVMTVLVLLLAMVLAVPIWRIVQERRKRREARKREEVRQHLLGLDLKALTPSGRRAAESVADRYGLSLEGLHFQAEHEAMAKHKAMTDRAQRELLDMVREEKARQRAMEQEAIDSILNERPEPRPGEQ